MNAVTNDCKFASYARTSVPIARPSDALAVLPVSSTKLEPLPTMKPPSVVARPATSCNCASSLALAIVPVTISAAANPGILAESILPVNSPAGREVWPDRDY